MMKSGLWEGPEVGVTSVGSGVARTMEEVTSYQL